ELVYRSGAPFTNDKLPRSETNWWLPIPDGKFHATKIRTFNKAKNQYYTTYNIQPTNARSKCARDTVPISALRKCAIEMPLTQLQVCNYMLAWTEGDWSSVEIEGTCDIRAPRIAYSHKAGSY
ncbi:hypothetical protein Tcan_16982, partial [Toxocara canis]